MAQTLIEFAKTVQDPLRKGIIETLYTEMRLMQYIPFRDVNGLALPYNQEESLPAVSFRNLNEGFTETTGVVNRKVETLKPFGADSDTDTVLVDAYGNAERVSRDTMHAKAQAVKFVQTMLYGNSPDSRAGTAFDDVKGFDGIQARLTSGQIIDGGGTAGSGGSSVFAIKFGDGYCQGLQTPKGLNARDLGEQDSKPVYRTRIDWTTGFAIYHGMAAAMIWNLEATVDVLTESLMDQLVDLIGGDPSVIVMSKRSRRQLKDDLSGDFQQTLDQVGRPVPAWNGVPIIVDDCIIDTEVTS